MVFLVSLRLQSTEIHHTGSGKPGQYSWGWLSAAAKFDLQLGSVDSSVPCPMVLLYEDVAVSSWRRRRKPNLEQRDDQERLGVTWLLARRDQNPPSDSQLQSRRPTGRESRVSIKCDCDCEGNCSRDPKRLRSTSHLGHFSKEKRNRSVAKFRCFHVKSSTGLKLQAQSRLPGNSLRRHVFLGRWIQHQPQCGSVPDVCDATISMPLQATATCAKGPGVRMRMTSCVCICNSARSKATAYRNSCSPPPARFRH